MKALLIAISCMVIVGCSSTSQQYYEAVQKTAEANAAAAQAKFDALSKIASAGDGQAASAAVMALALTQTQSVQPIPQQSEALQWASVLATPVTSLGMMWMQSDSAKTMARYNSQVDMARISADAETQQALYGTFAANSAATASVASAGFDAMGNIDYTPFIDGMVDLGTAGFDANTAIATVGLNTADNLGTTGMNNLTNLGAAGMANLVDLGTAGLGATVATADLGINGAVALGTTGMTNLTTLGTTGMADLRGLAQYGTLYEYFGNADWLTYATANNQTIEDMFGSIGCTVTTTTDGALVVTCN